MDDSEFHLDKMHESVVSDSTLCITSILSDHADEEERLESTTLASYINSDSSLHFQHSSVKGQMAWLTKQL